MSETMIEKWIAYKPQSVSKYNIPIMLNQNTQWSSQQKLTFCQKLPELLQEPSAMKAWQ